MAVPRDPAPAREAQPQLSRIGETVATAALGAVLGGAMGLPLGLAPITAGIAGVNGAISGWRGIYDWTSSRGLVAFVLDSTWGLPMTTAAAFSHAVAALTRDAGYVAELSQRQQRHVYRRGFVPRRGFLTTLGNVISGGGDVERSRRRRLITDHEDVHCWQARWFGPVFPVAYVGWMVLGGAIGALWWALRRRHDPIGQVIESSAYYLNPFEWWAYSRDGNWPPSGKVANFGWKQPCCRPLSET